MTDENFYHVADRRIEYSTVTGGIVGAICAGIVWGWRAGAGFAAGAAISWLSYRWIKVGVSGVAKLARAQRGEGKIALPRSVYVKFIGQYALLILAAYVILVHFALPAVSLLAGFGTVVVATLTVAAGQLFRSNSIPHGDR